MKLERNKVSKYIERKQSEIPRVNVETRISKALPKIRKILSEYIPFYSVKYEQLENCSLLEPIELAQLRSSEQPISYSINLINLKWLEYFNNKGFRKLFFPQFEKLKSKYRVHCNSQLAYFDSLQSVENQESSNTSGIYDNLNRPDIFKVYLNGWHTQPFLDILKIHYTRQTNERIGKLASLIRKHSSINRADNEEDSIQLFTTTYESSNISSSVFIRNIPLIIDNQLHHIVFDRNTFLYRLRRSNFYSSSNSSFNNTNVEIQVHRDYLRGIALNTKIAVSVHNILQDSVYFVDSNFKIWKTITNANSLVFLDEYLLISRELEGMIEVYRVFDGRLVFRLAKRSEFLDMLTEFLIKHARLGQTVYQLVGDYNTASNLLLSYMMLYARDITQDIQSSRIRDYLTSDLIVRFLRTREGNLSCINVNLLTNNHTK